VLIFHLSFVIYLFHFSLKIKNHPTPHVILSMTNEKFTPVEGANLKAKIENAATAGRAKMKNDK
jgi:hypothetical protein